MFMARHLNVASMVPCIREGKCRFFVTASKPAGALLQPGHAAMPHAASQCMYRYANNNSQFCGHFTFCKSYSHLSYCVLSKRLAASGFTHDDVTSLFEVGISCGSLMLMHRPVEHHSSLSSLWLTALGTGSNRPLLSYSFQKLAALTWMHGVACLSTASCMYC